MVVSSFGRESIVESQRPAGKGQSGEHVKKQPLYRADMRSVLDSCFDIDPVEKRFDRLAHGTHIRRKGIVQGNLFVEQLLAGCYQINVLPKFQFFRPLGVYVSSVRKHGPIGNGCTVVDHLLGGPQVA